MVHQLVIYGVFVLQELGFMVDRWIGWSWEIDLGFPSFPQVLYAQDVQKKKKTILWVENLWFTNQLRTGGAPDLNKRKLGMSWEVVGKAHVEI